MQAIVRSVLFALLFGAALYFFILTHQFDFPRVPGRLGPFHSATVWLAGLLYMR